MVREDDVLLPGFDAHTSRPLDATRASGSGPLLEALSSRIIVSPQLRQEILATPFPPTRTRADELAGSIALQVWACTGSSAIDVLRDIERKVGTLELVPRDTIVPVESEPQIATARRTVDLLAIKLGFSAMRRTKVAVAVSELARNIHAYAGRGEIRLSVVLPPNAAVIVEARDRGSGIAELEAVLAGTYRSRSGLGLGLRGVRAIADEFKVDTSSAGTLVRAVFSAAGRK